MPSDYRGIDYNVMPGFDYDFFVIGAGSGGVRAARIAAGLGARTAIAEARFMGGTCVNVGCIPKKLYAYAAHFAADFQESAAFGWQEFRNPDFDWSSLKSNKDNEIKRLLASRVELVNEIWMARSLTMMNLVSNRLSNMAFLEIYTDVDVEDEYLTTRTLTDVAFRDSELEKLRQQVD